jgi:nucleoside-diphosphate kinase
MASIPESEAPRGLFAAACLLWRADIMIKPDGVQRGLVGEIIKRFEQKGFKLVAIKIVAATDAILQVRSVHPTRLQPRHGADASHDSAQQEHYRDLAGRPFFPGLVAYMVSDGGSRVALGGEGRRRVVLTLLLPVP